MAVGDQATPAQLVQLQQKLRYTYIQYTSHAPSCVYFVYAHTQDAEMFLHSMKGVVHTYTCVCIAGPTVCCYYIHSMKVWYNNVLQGGRRSQNKVERTSRVAQFPTRSSALSPYLSEHELCLSQYAPLLEYIMYFLLNRKEVGVEMKLGTQRSLLN